MRRNLILLITSTILVVSFGFSTAISLKSIDTLVKANNKDNSVIYANEVSNAVIDVFSEAVAVSQMMNNTLIRKILKDTDSFSDAERNEIIRNYLSDIVSTFGFSTAFLADDRTMSYYAEQGFTKTIDPSNPDDDWYIPFKSSGKLYELNVDNDQANNNRMTIYINARMKDSNGQFLGVCGVGVPIKQVILLLQSIEAQNDISIKLVSPDGVVRVARSGQLVFQRTEQELKELLKQYNTSEPYTYFSRDADGYTIIKYIAECDWYAVIDYEGGKSTQFSTLLFKNLMVCLFIMLAVLTVVNFVLNNFTRHTEKFVEEALEDQLTGLKNRRAYSLEVERLNKLSSLQEITVVTMDINGLKLTNDSFGHTAGDDLLRGAAQIMKDFFNGNGWNLFRTGGDEFIALTTQPVPDKTELTKEFKQKLTLFHHELIKELSVSIGVAKGDEAEITSVEDLIKMADKKMYADKEVFYSDNAHERRKR